MLPKQKAVEIIFPLEISIIIWDLREWCFNFQKNSWWNKKNHQPGLKFDFI
ncbi:hypothetical protein [Spiroplasma endosymbiont of Zeiraphera isertana]|uniref:hypothetical protein n=1 Tax=Spiroplasma endosymbiont of Zeiraphera isertana TaxID=3066313 RepID=UPI00313F3659